MNLVPLYRFIVSFPKVALTAFGSLRWQIINRGFGSKLGIEGITATIANQLAHLAIGIIQISKRARLRHAIGNARRIQSLREPRRAEVAFRDYAGAVTPVPHLLERRWAVWEVVAVSIVEKSLMIRASQHTSAAADALFCVDIDNAVRPFESRAGGTNLVARRLGAMVALKGNGGAAHLGIFTGFMFDHTQPHDARRGCVLRLANQGTARAADALLEVDDHSVSHSPTRLSRH
jgi:hypothetical protein